MDTLEGTRGEPGVGAEAANDLRNIDTPPYGSFPDDYIERSAAPKHNGPSEPSASPFGPANVLSTLFSPLPFSVVCKGAFGKLGTGVIDLPR